MVNDLLTCYFYGLLLPVPLLVALYFARALMRYFAVASDLHVGD